MNLVLLWLHPITAHHQRHKLNSKSFERPFATRIASLARAGSAGKQATDHHLGNLTTARRRILLFYLLSRHQLAPILTRIGSDRVVSICIIELWIQSSLRSMSCAKLRDTTAGQTNWSVLDVLSGTSSAWMGWRSQLQRSATPWSHGAPPANVQRMGWIGHFIGLSECGRDRLRFGCTAVSQQLRCNIVKGCKGFQQRPFVKFSCLTSSNSLVLPLDLNLTRTSC
jgi:hypothetical protein